MPVIPAPTSEDMARDLATEYMMVVCGPLIDSANRAGLIRRAHAAEAEVKRLREVLRSIAGHAHGDPNVCQGITPYDCLDTVREMARAALETTP